VSAKILVIDDEPGIRALLSHELRAEGHSVDTAADGVEGVACMKANMHQIAFCDINMPRLGGLETLAEIRKLNPDAEIIMMTGYATIESAVEAMKKGAYDFVQKPFNLKEVLALIDKSVEKSDLKSVVQELREAKKKLEETQMQLIQSEKLAGIGQLAAGVAHELNNPMSGIMGFSQLLLDDASLTGQHRSDVETIFTQSQRCKTIIQNLLQFCRRKEHHMAPVDLVPLVQSAVNLVQYEFSTTGIQIEQKLPPSLPLVMADASQIQQIFLNLITNARQAIEEKPEGRLVIEGGVEGEHVFLRFGDNGPGVPDAIKEKIFEPFFTTKAPGKGTGLGLSISYGILKNHNGSLSVENRAEGGAVFVMKLPLIQS
jgi:two-component system, NtrC family, sensor kinase